MMSNTDKIILLRKIEIAINAVFAVIMIAYLIFYAFIGGSALLGHIDNSRYYVADHGTLTEVSETIWYISLIWNYVFFIIFPLDIGLTLWIEHIKRKRHW